MHCDAIFENAEQKVLERAIRSRPGWERGQCAWDMQMNLLVALQMPSHGGGLEYYDARGGGVELRRIEHQVGKAILVESLRPHKVGTFSSSDVDGLEPRVVLVAFVVPCWSSLSFGKPSGELSYLMTGPLGGPHYEKLDAQRKLYC